MKQSFKRFFENHLRGFHGAYPKTLVHSLFPGMLNSGENLMLGSMTLQIP